MNILNWESMARLFREHHGYGLVTREELTNFVDDVQMGASNRPDSWIRNMNRHAMDPNKFLSPFQIIKIPGGYRAITMFEAAIRHPEQFYRKTADTVTKEYIKGEPCFAAVKEDPDLSADTRLKFQLIREQEKVDADHLKSTASIREQFIALELKGLRKAITST